MKPILVVLFVAMCFPVFMCISSWAQSPATQAVTDDLVQLLGSADPLERQAAERQILSLGKSEIDSLRRANGRLNAIFANIDAIATDTALPGKVREAVEYFASMDAFQYLFISLHSTEQNRQGWAADAIARMKPELKEQHRKLLVKEILAYFSEQQFYYQGSDVYTAQISIRGKLARILAELLGMDPRFENDLDLGTRTDDIVNAAKAWLAATK